MRPDKKQWVAVYPTIDKLKPILVKRSYVSAQDADAAEAASKNSSEFVQYILANELAAADDIGQAVADAFTLPYANFTDEPPAPDVVKEIPLKISRDNRFVLFHKTADSIRIATDSPANKELKSVLTNLFKGKKVYVFYALPDSIDECLHVYDASLDTKFTEIIKQNKKVAPELIHAIIKDASKFGTSDIHFEPQPDNVIIRFRIDGALRLAGAIPKDQYETVLNRIKIESGMRIDEHYKPQDGGMQVVDGMVVTDLRVSLAPTVQGEKIVMRVMSSFLNSNLQQIGLNDAHLALIEDFSKKPYGMMIVAGPTGSGKTTTLYTTLNLVNHPDVNITTIEDPVEVKMPGINQIEVKEHIDLTFAKGLRSIVRQDPDVILVGEIRDEDTAVISVNAALTGHLLLTTFHANNAATAIPRLLNMGVEPFLLASTLQLVVAQRLVRQICPQCRTSVTADVLLQNHPKAKELKQFLSPKDELFVGKGCLNCNNTGYTGRTAIFEFIVMSPELQQLMLNDPSAQEIQAVAVKNGCLPMFLDGLEKARQGVTTLEEVLRTAEIPVNS